MKEAGVSTGEAIWEARQKCPDLILVPPDFPKYIRFSQKARAIYYRYTNQVESFGLDEAWLDLTGTAHLLGDGMTMAKKISHTIKEELGLTVSIGVSYNKIFAKFGSDYQKPDAITAVTRDNYQHPGIITSTWCGMPPWPTYCTAAEPPPVSLRAWALPPSVSWPTWTTASSPLNWERWA